MGISSFRLRRCVVKILPWEKKKILQASQVKYVRAGEKTKITPGENKNK